MAPRRLDLTKLAIAAEERAAAAEERAAHAHQHAAGATEEALRDAIGGDQEHERMHRQESELHKGAARRQEEAAALQRLHAARLREKR